MPPTVQNVHFPILTFPSLESLPSDSPVRRLYPDDTYPNGEYYHSPLGRIRFWIYGPSDGPKVSLIHGISTPSILFKDLADELVEAGFQLLLYDVYGRGYSEAPTDVLSNNDYITQLALLLQYVGWKSTYVVGMSMGGGIAAAFTSAFPHLVNGKIVLLASAGLVAGRKLGGFEKKRHESKKDGANQVSNDTDPEGTPSTLVNSTGSGPSVKLGPGADPQLRKLLASSLPGLKRIIKDTRRFGPVAGLEKAFESLATVQTAGGSLRVLVIHGTKDLVVPYTEAAKVKALVPHAEVVTIEGADHHFLGHPDHWPIIARNIARFLSA